MTDLASLSEIWPSQLLSTYLRFAEFGRDLLRGRLWRRPGARRAYRAGRELEDELCGNLRRSALLSGAGSRRPRSRVGQALGPPGGGPL